MKRKEWLLGIVILLVACKTPTGIYNDDHYSDAIHVSSSEFVNRANHKVDRGEVETRPRIKTGESVRLQQDKMQMRMNLHRAEMLQNRPATFTPAAHSNLNFNN